MNTPPVIRDLTSDPHYDRFWPNLLSRISSSSTSAPTLLLQATGEVPRSSLSADLTFLVATASENEEEEEKEEEKRRRRSISVSSLFLSRVKALGPTLALIDWCGQKHSWVRRS